MHEDDIPQDRRMSTRVDSGHLVIHTDVAETDPNRTLGIGVTIDINEFGLKVQSREAMPLGERFRFSVAVGDQIIEASGKVVHVGRALNGTFEMGIEFIDIGGSEIEKIRAHLAGDER